MQPAVKVFDIAVLPRVAGFNERCLDTHSLEALAHRFCGKFRTIIAANIFRRPTVHKHLHQVEQHIVEAQARAFIEDRQQLNRPANLYPNRYDVLGPDMIRLLRAEPDTGPTG